MVFPEPEHHIGRYRTLREAPMIGKKNIVFGFLYLAMSAALGPYMIFEHFPAQANAESIKQEQLGKLQQARGNGYLDENLESMSADSIARSNTSAILALSGRINADLPIAGTRNAHAHGNLEALLNIVVGFLLCFVAVSVRFKQIISWIFIAGAVLHSGLLYLAVGLQVEWAGGLMATWVSYIGPILVLTGLVLAGVAAAIGFRAEFVRDW
jgi:hypothetical protein